MPRKKLFTFYFKHSRNGCDVLVDTERPHSDLMNSIFVEWDVFPPSRKDRKIWARKYFPKVCRRLGKLLGNEQVIAWNALDEGGSGWPSNLRDRRSERGDLKRL